MAIEEKPQLSTQQRELVGRIVEDALSQPAAQRAVYVREQAGDDEVVRSLAMSIVQRDESATGDLPELPEWIRGIDFRSAKQADGAASLSEASSSPFAPGMALGPYTLRKRLGRGGFGEVWRAERREPDMTVAIKVVRPDRTDKSNLARFAAESQALALLDHPNIAKIHDAGVTDVNSGGTSGGIPYLVMEYVQGVPLNEYCDRERLAIKQRLELMAKICDAVHHAHTQGLIHRDLSPDNILVTIHENNAPEPKIVDFGIAKAVNKNLRLTEQTLTQDLNTLIGKPAYMAPEQAEAKQVGVDTRTDIFSLGVILYEMLTGVLPIPPEQLREQAIEAVLAMLRGERPDPSTRISSLTDDQSRSAAQLRGLADPDDLRRLLRGRVQHLPMKALRVDRTKRFSSAAAMALDIRNYLEGKDFIEAAAEPWWDKAQRHVGRHKLPYAAAALVILALVGGIVGTTWGMRQAQGARAAEADARQIAEREKQIAQAVNDFMNDDLLGIHHRDVFTQDLRVVDALDAAMHALHQRRRFDGEPAIAGRLFLTLGEAYLALGTLDQARAALVEARSRLDVDSPGDTAVVPLIDIYLGEIHYRQLECEEAEHLIMPAYEALIAIHGADSPLTIGGLNHVANVFKCQRRFDEAKQAYRSVIERFDRVQPAARQSLIARHNLGVISFDRGRSLFRDDPAASHRDFEQALELLQSVHARMVDAYGRNSRVALSTETVLARCMFWLGRFEGATAQLEAAAAYYDDLLPRIELGLTPNNWRTIHTLANAGNVHRLLGDYERALELYAESMRRFEATHPLTDPYLRATFRHLVRTLVVLHRAEEARVLLIDRRRTLLEAAAPEDVVDEVNQILAEIP